MMNKEQLLVLFFLFVGFIFFIITIRFWPIKKAVSTHVEGKYRKLNLLTGQVLDITEPDFKNDIALLMAQGYQLTFINELFNVIENRLEISDKFFVVLGKDNHDVDIETLTQKLVLQKVSIIFYRPLF